MYGGIDQLVDTYKGNPQPLAQKVQRDQQSQPPGRIPPDLEEALALQKITELRNSAQSQQAMQAGGAQPSVVEKLRQMLGGMQQQAQMAQAPQQMAQGQPVMAARGGSIDQLMSNLGRHYAGGGIVAFNGEENNNPVEDPNADKRSWIERNFYENISPAEKERRRRLALLAAANQGIPVEQEAAPRPSLTPQQMEAFVKAEQPESPAPQQTEASDKPAPLRQVTQRELAEEYNRKRWAQQAEDAAKPKESYGAALEKFLYSNITPAEQRRREALQAAANARAGISAPVPPTTLSNRAALNAADAGLRSQPGASNRALLNAADAGLRSQPAESAPAVVKPTGAGVAGAGIAGIAGGPAKPAVEAMDPMEVALRKSIMDALAQDPEALRKKAMEDNAKFVGLDALLKPARDRIAAREAMIKGIQANRTPDWVEALAGARKQTRGGIGSLIGQMGDTAQTTREGYQTEDLKFFDELSRLNSEIDKAKIEGRYKDVAAGQAAVKDLISEKRQAEQSGTSLLNKQAQIEATKQIAADNRAARAQSASQHADNKNLALEERKRQFNEELLRKIREKDVDRAAKIEAAIAKRTGNIDLQLQSSKLKPEVEADLLRRRNEIVKQVQAEYPPVKPEGAKFLGFEPSKKP